MKYKKQIKNVYTGHIAECYTRQRTSLPSVRAIALGKEPDAGKVYLGTGKVSLPSAVAPTLGKEASFPECLLEHSTKNLTPGPAGGPFVECRLVDTRQRGNFFAECHLEHSGKTPSPLPGAVTTTFLCQVPDKKYSTKKPLLMYSSPSSLCRV
jgi:hypothetical protein